MRNSNMELAYVLVWRNDVRSPTHYYAPYPGHASVPDFIKFYNDPYTLFENDLKGIYGKLEDEKRGKQFLTKVKVFLTLNSIFASLPRQKRVKKLLLIVKISSLQC